MPSKRRRQNIRTKSLITINALIYRKLMVSRFLIWWGLVRDLSHNLRKFCQKHKWEGVRSCWISQSGLDWTLWLDWFCLLRKFSRSWSSICFQFIYLFYLFLVRWVFVAMLELSLIVVSYSSLQYMGFSLPRLLSWAQVLDLSFSNCSPGVQWLWLIGPRACGLQSGMSCSLRHVESSCTRHQTSASALAREFLPTAMPGSPFTCFYFNWL